jgi:hypothetical protein
MKDGVNAEEPDAGKDDEYVQRREKPMVRSPDTVNMVQGNEN